MDVPRRLMCGIMLACGLIAGAGDRACAQEYLQATDRPQWMEAW